MHEMKDSGIAWIGEIPDSWQTVKLKYIADVNGRIGFRGYTESDLVDEGEGAITLSPSNIADGKMNYHKCSYISWKKYDESPEIQIKNDDILFVKTGSSYGKSCFVSGLYMEATINPQLAVLKNIKIDNKFLSYSLKTESVEIQSELAVVGGTIPTMSQTKIGNFIILIPKLSEQKKIAEFLDGKFGEIDALKEDIKTQIETLEQYKRSVITEAVTKGLNKSAPLKDSGIPWIGAIPENWKCVKGKYLFTQRNLRGNKIELQLLSPSQRFGVIPQTVYEELTTQVVVKVKDNTNLSLFKTVHKGDFCISLRSFQGGFEYSAYEGVVSPAYTIFYPIINICDGYYKRLFKENSFIEIINSYALSLRDGKNISFEDFGKTYIPYPPINEQKQIADYLDKKCAEIDKIISDKQSQIDTLEEYKKSLIFEYVTGKKEVK